MASRWTFVPVLLLGMLPLHAQDRVIEGAKPMPRKAIDRMNERMARRQGPYDTPVQVVKAYIPIYPISHLLSGKEGVCNVVFTIDTSGRAVNREPDPGADKKMCAHAVYALQFWEFEPATKDGQPVEYRMRIPFAYSF